MSNLVRIPQFSIRGNLPHPSKAKIRDHPLLHGAWISSILDRTTTQVLWTEWNWSWDFSTFPKKNNVSGELLPVNQLGESVSCLDLHRLSKCRGWTIRSDVWRQSDLFSALHIVLVTLLAWSRFSFLLFGVPPSQLPDRGSFERVYPTGNTEDGLGWNDVQNRSTPLCSCIPKVWNNEENDKTKRRRLVGHERYRRFVRHLHVEPKGMRQNPKVVRMGYTNIL